MLERLHQEINQRTRVARLFPNEASLLRLVSAIEMEVSEDWVAGNRYLNMNAENENVGKNVSFPSTPDANGLRRILTCSNTGHRLARVAFFADLLTEDLIFFNKIFNSLGLLTINPASQHCRMSFETLRLISCKVDHGGGNLIKGQDFLCSVLFGGLLRHSIYNARLFILGNRACTILTHIQQSQCAVFAHTG